ncbi:MAG: Hsp20/alpha crystallin family protein [Deltaproteobacteria bacterium]|nr:Hsp20/alpha crystallin family protein [Deltaproteobacteria bacterium]
MAIITRNDPFRDLFQLQNQLFRTFDGAFDPRTREDMPQTAAFTPAVDIFEDEHAITLKVELPEVKLEDIDLSVDGNQLSVKGQRTLEKSEKRDGYHRIERSYGSFARTFTLPDTVDAQNIGAESKDGVLRVTLPKKAEVKPRQIKVNVGGALPAGATKA